MFSRRIHSLGSYNLRCLIDPPITSPFFSHLSLHLCGPQSQYPTFEICQNSFDSETQFVLTFSVTDPEIPGHVIIHSAAGPESKISSTPAGAFTEAAYPIFNLCKSGYYRPLSSLMVREDPAVYPFFDLYPSVDKYNPPTVSTEISLNGNYL